MSHETAQSPIGKRGASGRSEGTPLARAARECRRAHLFAECRLTFSKLGHLRAQLCILFLEHLGRLLALGQQTARRRKLGLAALELGVAGGRTLPRDSSATICEAQATVIGVLKRSSAHRLESGFVLTLHSLQEMAEWSIALDDALKERAAELEPTRRCLGGSVFALRGLGRWW